MSGPSWYDAATPLLRPAARPGAPWALEGRLLLGEYPAPDGAWLREERIELHHLTVPDGALEPCLARWLPDVRGWNRAWGWS